MYAVKNLKSNEILSPRYAHKHEADSLVAYCLTVAPTGKYAVIPAP